ncbi:MAG: XRE family transcriptional regulator [Deltaproteobacteria bacterium]|nr:MAG: XRE family transcriptional regulator [Deltaproteobacteria bacterium]
MPASDTDPCTYGLLLRELRMARGLSLYKLADALDVTPTEVGEWELELASPTRAQSQALYQVLVRNHATSETVYARKLERLALSRDAIHSPSMSGPARDATYWLTQARVLADVGSDMAAAASQMSKANALDKLSDMTCVFELISICTKHVAAMHRSHGA